MASVKCVHSDFAQDQGIKNAATRQQKQIGKGPILKKQKWC
jgi:hypothetical protein